MCRRVALRYSVGLMALSCCAPLLDVTTWTFAIDSVPVNAYLVYLGKCFKIWFPCCRDTKLKFTLAAWRFYKDSDSKSSRKLFMYSLVHLPALLVLLLISKKHDSNKTEAVVAT
jgi:heme o synthase